MSSQEDADEKGGEELEEEAPIQKGPHDVIVIKNQQGFGFNVRG